MISVLVALGLTACSGPDRNPVVDDDADGYAAADDCDDHGATINPGAAEACNGVDDDCDGETDEAGATGALTFYADADADGYGDAGVPSQACTRPAGTSADATDCDDTRANAHPGAAEACNGEDDDCDEAVDEDPVDADSWYADADGDGYGAGVAIEACAQPEGSAATDDDCDDADASRHPDAPETCDEVDADCDGQVAEDDSVDATVLHPDTDGDGFGAVEGSITSCTAVDGYVEDATDCDDTTAAVSPVGLESCNGEDDDCDAEVDEDEATDALPWYADVDADTYGDPTSTHAACAAPAGFVADASDCDDTRADVSPDGTERCDGEDDDCDGNVDEDDAADAATWYADADGDTYGDATTTHAACAAPAGFVADDTDCDDADATAWPGADETCDGTDDDCDGTTDESDAVDAPEWFTDGDGDGYGSASAGTSCTDPGGVVADGGDCDDADGSVHPGATETCDGVDTDCDGDETDAINATRYYADADGDGYGDPAVEVRDCTQPAGTAHTDTDCDDTLASVNPGEAEVCNNGLDDNCSSDADTCPLDGTMSTWDAFVVTAAWGSSSAITTTAPRVLDVDGDGVSDLASGSSWDDTGGSNAGVGLVYLGPVTSLGGGADVTLVGEDADDLAGYRVDSVGDLGGAGASYLAVTAPGATVSTRTGAGTVYLFAEVPTSAASLDLSMADARVDGDAGSGLGGDGVAGVGDVDGDGLDELVIAEDTGGSVSGRVSAFVTASGGSYRESDASWMIDGDEANDGFGTQVVALGDDDGDGLADFAVSAPYADSGAGNAGSLHVFYGADLTSTSLTAADAAARVDSTTANDSFGVDLDVGDLDGDGSLDLLGGGHQSAGYAYVELGPFHSKGSADLTSLDLRVGTWYNAFAGDVDADGTDDLLYSYYYGMVSNQGYVALTYGPTALGTASITGWSAAGIADGGSNVTGVLSPPGGGDVDDDGYSDVLVPMYAVCNTTTTCGGLYRGSYIAIQYGRGG